jgi:hypothetical protein
MSLIAPLANKLRIAAVSGNVSHHWPNGGRPIIGIQPEPLPRRVLMMPSGVAVASPATAVMTDNVDLAQERNPVQREIVKIGQLIGAHEAVFVGMSLDGDLLTPLPRADLKTRAIFRQGVWAIFIRKRDGHSILRRTLLCVISVTNAL